MFVDTALITVKGGNGGAGAVTFHREKYVAAGGPDGGDGGNGGSVIFEVDSNLSTLSDFRYKRKYTAPDGEKGGSSRKNGKKGADIIVRVPCGTIVKEVSSGTVLADMSDGTPFVAAKGGRGGRGNVHFATPVRQCPRFAQSGEPGEEWELSLELKLLADVGLIGFPNVGKSTLISVVSQAKPNIADYHFTTLTPVLGVVRTGPENSFVMADIPGLIEGASEGAGLGHEFLRHIQRCRLLVHLVDVAGSEGRDPKEDFVRINSELSKFDPALSSRPQIVAGSKADLATKEQLSSFREYITGLGYEYHEICAPIEEGTKELIDAVARALAKLPPVEVVHPGKIPLSEIEAKKKNGFTVTVSDGVYNVEAEWLAKILNRTDLDDYESMEYFQKLLERTGIIAELERRGIREGDTVDVYDFEFTYVP